MERKRDAPVTGPDKSQAPTPDALEATPVYRPGNHWGVTIVQEGIEPPDQTGKRRDAQLLAVVVNGDHGLAQHICNLLTEHPYTPER